MKIITLMTASSLLAIAILPAEDEFNFENIKEQYESLEVSLETNQTALAWLAAKDPAVKGEKFTLMLQEIGGPIISRQWNYPGANEWPLIDWSKVGSLSELMNNQKRVLAKKHVVAENNAEYAKFFVITRTTHIMGAEISIWYEDWLLSLAKGSNANLKRIIFLTTTSGFGEDIARETGSTRTVDWNKWEAAFNQADNLGKALLLVCMTDLAGRNENYTKLTAMHLSVFEGTNDDLKAIALYAGDRSLGPAVISKWQDIADNHSNVKLKALAQELLNRHSVESP